jgi:hypothetical protein
MHFPQLTTEFRMAILLATATTILLETPARCASSIIVPSQGCTTIGRAMLKVKSGDTVWVEEGVYPENVSVANGVVLVSRSLFKAVINGRGMKKVITLGPGSTIIGFDIRNGDFGVYATAAGTAILKCRIYDNKMSGVQCVGNLPRIEDTYIFNNSGSGIQGWDVRSTMSAISHNTIVYNGNNGIAMGGNSEITIENNIIAFNIKIGFKAEATVRATMKNNCFYSNTEVAETLPETNISVNPLFVAAIEKNFMLTENSQCRNNGSDNQNIGARLAY